MSFSTSAFGNPGQNAGVHNWLPKGTDASSNGEREEAEEADCVSLFVVVMRSAGPTAQRCPVVTFPMSSDPL